MRRTMYRTAGLVLAVSLLLLAGCSPNTPPVVEAVTIAPDGPRTNATVSADVVAHDEDGNPLRYQYRWLRNGEPVPDADGPVLDLARPGAGDQGDAVAVVASVSDGRDTSDEVTSAEVVVEPAVTLEIRETVEHYAVQGRTTEELFQSIQARGLGEIESGFASGVMVYELAYPWDGRMADDRCVIDAMTVRASITVTLPTNDGPLPPPLAPKWERFADTVEWHEGEHVEILRRHLEVLRAELEGLSGEPSCDALEEEIDRIWLERRRLETDDQDRFHEEEEARIETQCAPLRADLGEARARLDELSGRIVEVNRELDRLERQGDAGGYNAAVDEYNALVRIYNQSLPTVAGLADDYTWCAAS